MFRRLADETGSPEDAMWAVLQEDRREREIERRWATVFDPAADAIITAVCRRLGVSKQEISRPGPRGRQAGPGIRFTWARRVAMRALRDEGLSFPAIGQHLGRHHTTVMYALAKVADDEKLVAEAKRVRAAAKRVA